MAGTKHAEFGTLSDRELGAVLRVAGVTSSATDVADGTMTIMELIGTFIPYAAISLSVWNPLSRRHSTVGASGYPDEMVDAIDDYWIPHDLILARTRATGRPARWRDTPDYLDSRSVQEYLLPAGYSEGMGSSLFDHGGRYTGMLSLDCDSAKIPSETALEATALIQPLLAGFVDTLRGPVWLTRGLAADQYAGIVTVSGQVAPIPGRTPGPLLYEGSPFVADVARALVQRHRRYRYWWQDGVRGWHRVTLSTLPHGAVVVTTAGQLPHQLSMRELDVLTVLSEGASNAEIARRLYLAERTVANHVASVLDKLDMSSRAGAAACAISEGLIRRPAPGAQPTRKSSTP